MALYYQLSTQNVLTKFLSVSSITGGNSVNNQQLASTVASLITTSVIPANLSTQALTASSITASTITSPIISTLVLYASSIIGVTTGGLAVLPSTVSTFSLLTSSLQVSTATGITISAQQLFVSSILGNTISSIGITTGTLIATNLFASTATLSTFSTNTINFAGGFGYLTMPDIYPNTVFTSTVTTSNLLVGVNSVVSPIQFYGFGNYTNSVVAELSTGGTTQELLMFRGSNATDRIRFQTTGSVVFEPGVSARVWPTVPSNVTPAMIITTSSNVGIQTASPGATLDVAGTGRFIVASTQQLFVSSVQSFFVGSQTLSTLNINVSTINGRTFGAPITSTSIGLGTLGYISSTQLISTVAGLGQIYLSTGGGGGGITTGNLQSTVAGLGAIYFSTPPLALSTAGFFTSSVTASSITTSSLQVNSLVIGSGTGWVNIGPIQTVVLSSIQLNANDGYINTLYVGNQSTMNDIAFNGLFGNYNNTVLAEVSTGGGTQEFLVFKGSSASDRVRVQTTGNFVIETGVSARLFNSNLPQITNSNTTPAFIINTSSNVGIQTASPGATLDVAGTGRFQQLSTLNINVSTINGLTFGAPINSTVIGLGSAGYISTAQLLSTTAGLVEVFELTSTIAGLGLLFPSTLSMNSSISAYISSFSTTLGTVGGGGITTGNLQSTVAGLGQIYLSTGGGGGLATIPANLSTSAFFTSSAIISTATILTMSSLITNASTVTANLVTASTVATNGVNIGTNASWILTAPIQNLALSTNTIWADQSFINTNNVTTEIASTITTNAVTLGTGANWILTSPLQTAILSSIFLYANTPFLDTVNVGSVSTVNILEYAGLFNNYNNTVLAEISTGAGTQEFLVFKGSSASDRVRVQTTGAFVVETGVSARLFNSNTTQTLSNTTPAFVINTSSNVGIQTANPGATLDVAGTVRGTSVSTLAFNVSSINASLPFTTINATSSITGLGSAGYLSSIPLNVSSSAVFVSSISTNVVQAVILSSLALFASSIVAPYVFQPQFFTF